MKDFILNILVGILGVIISLVIIGIGVWLAFTKPGHIVLLSVVGTAALWFVGGIWRGKIQLSDDTSSDYNYYE